MLLSTINVIEMIRGQIHSVHSFTDDETGYQESNKCFYSFLKSINPYLSEDLMKEYLTHGVYFKGDYHVEVVHSEEGI